MAEDKKNVRLALEKLGVNDPETIKTVMEKVDTLEVEEKNGHKMIHAVGEDTEYYFIQVKDKVIMALKDEDIFSYFAQTKDGTFAQISSEDFYLEDNGKKASFRVNDGEGIITFDVERREDGTPKRSRLNVVSIDDVADDENLAYLKKIWPFLNKEEEVSLATISAEATYDRDGHVKSIKAKDKLFMEDEGERQIKAVFGKNNDCKEMFIKGFDSEGDLVDIKVGKDGQIIEGVVVGENGIWKYKNGEKEFVGVDIGLTSEIKEEYAEAKKDYKKSVKEEFSRGYTLIEARSVDGEGIVEYYRSDDSQDEPYKISKEEYDSEVTYKFVQKRDKLEYAKANYDGMQQGKVIDIAGYKIAYTPAADMKPEDVQAYIDAEMYQPSKDENLQITAALKEQAAEGGELPDNPKARAQNMRISAHLERRSAEEQTHKPENTMESTQTSLVMSNLSDGR